MRFPSQATTLDDANNDGGQLPIVLVADSDGEETIMDSEAESEVAPLGPLRRRKPEEPQLPAAPRHPIPSMQNAFAESLAEATQGAAIPKPKLRTGDAKARREELLDQDADAAPPAALWRYRPGQKSHELCRLMAQISFGVYLLLNGMANSQISVVSILQGHIDEVDEFLETTLEDIALATRDLKERIDHLKLPMDNMELFERMLEDRAFRLQIVEGNEKIEHIVARTQVALDQTVEDLAEGLESTRQFSIYLAEQQHGRWRQERPDVIDIFEAMKGNTDGWYNAFLDLQAKGSALNAVIVKLVAITSELERRAGEVSRKTRVSITTGQSTNRGLLTCRQFSIQPYTSPTHSPQPSDSSSVITTPASSPSKLSKSPPRLSLRLSTLGSDRLSDTLISRDSQTFGNQLGITESQTQITPPQEDMDEPAPQSPPARNPRRLSERKSQLLESTAEKKEDDSTLYILQPRTYTPQPPSPLPSPRMPEERPKPQNSPAKPRIESSARSTRSAKSARSAEVPVEIRIEEELVAQSQLRPQPSKPKLVAIGAPKANPDLAPRPSREPYPEVVVQQPQQRTSLRQRVSLKTSPPASIQVPGPDAPELRRPAYQAPDSAYGSDMERPPVNSMAYTDPNPVDFPPPMINPGLIPSPHSDQQFFRPVQASPHSPLQQRPHTSGTVAGGYPMIHHQYHHQNHPPPRNTPSAMGMSMLSNVTTMTHDTAGGASGRSVKKKRSAFGWLKKAFALDDEERAAFEQRRREETRNLYYDSRSPQFLDGKRIQPRQQQSQQGYY